MPTLTFEIPPGFQWGPTQVQRQDVLEWMIPTTEAERAFNLETRTVVTKPKPKRKLRKPRRLKQYKPRLTCSACKVTMDPHGNYHRPQGFPICKKCFSKRFYQCQVCQQNKTIPTRARTNPRRCRRCAINLRSVRERTCPRRVRDVSWRRGDATPGKKFEIVKSARTFGIEIETATCQYVERLEDKTTFGAKYDPTVRGREFDSPILAGDEGLQVVTDFCDHAKRRGWIADRTCGLHLHIGMQNEAVGAVRRIAYAYLQTYTTWITLIDPHRIDAQYTHTPRANPATVRSCEDFFRFCEDSNRYEFVNIAAWPRHNTIEIRGLQGTLNKSLITNWIIAHLAFADFAANSTYAELDRLLVPNENQCWHNMKSQLGTATRYFGRVRARNQRVSN